MLNRPEHGYAIDTQADAALLNINGVSVLIHPDVLRHLANDLAAAAAVYRTPGHTWGRLNEQEKSSVFGARVNHWVQQARTQPTRQTVGLRQQQAHPLGLAHMEQTPPFAITTIPITAESQQRGDQLLSLEELLEEDEAPLNH